MQKSLYGKGPARPFARLVTRVRAWFRVALVSTPKPDDPLGGTVDMPDYLLGDVGLLPRTRLNRPQAPPPSDPLRFL